MALLTIVCPVVVDGQLEDQVRSNRGDGLEASEKLGATQAMVETQELTIRRLEEEKAMAIDEAKEAHWRVQEGRREYEEVRNVGGT
jgi:uncharacterized protein with von Willebrand factor type A (vWA) domain